MLVTNDRFGIIGMELICSIAIVTDKREVRGQMGCW